MGPFRWKCNRFERELELLRKRLLVAQAELEIATSNFGPFRKRAEEDAILEKRAAELRIKLLEAEAKATEARNSLTTASDRLQRKKSSEKAMKLLKLELARERAVRGLVQTERNKKARLTRAKGDYLAADERLKKHEELLNRYREAVESCRIYAPGRGLVLYGRGEDSTGTQIRAGYVARCREPILSFPNLNHMQVVTHIGQELFAHVAEGCRATVRPTAFPNRNYPARVQSVAQIPSRVPARGGDEISIRVVVGIDGEVEGLMPGMTAEVEIDAGHVDDVLTVPAEAILQGRKGPWCYVKTTGGIERRRVRLGVRASPLVEICDGLSVGDQVVINPDVVDD